MSVNDINIEAVNRRAAAQALGSLGGKIGGKSRSEAKLKAVRENIKKATAARLKKLSTQDEPTNT